MVNVKKKVKPSDTDCNCLPPADQCQSPFPKPR